MKTFAEVINGTVVNVRDCADDHVLECAPPVQFIAINEETLSPKNGYTWNGVRFLEPLFDPIPMIEQNIARLWQSANNYETAQISGSASAMVALGLVKGSPAALRVSAWTQSIWELYYKRKPLITHEWNEELLDFSECGPMPCTVSELMKEIMS